ncbi:hypothetical protein B5X24_HaOG209849 [Helicoverpa armigera]|nr:hypothetical protein B5X24_HaOG209849 [Helicoverpa armigera]
MLRTIVVPILKNKTGDISDPANYRPISLATIIAKILDSLLDNRLDNWLSIHDAQFGFKPRLSTESAIYGLKQTVQYYVDRGTPVYACFLDLSRAFDLVSYDVLWEKLREVGVPSEVVCLFKYWYSNQTNQIRWQNSLSEEYRLECGVRQGGISSPKLFNLYLNKLIVELSSKPVGCKVGNVSVNNLSYADDMVLLGPTAGAIREMLRTCEEYAVKHGLMYNVRKSEYLIFGAPDDLKDQVDMDRERRTLAARCNMLAHRSKPLLDISQLPSWVVITPERQRRDAEGFIDLIMKTAGGVGFRMPKPEIIPIRNDGPMEYANACENAIARKNPAMILCVLARKFADRYEAIKKKCTVDRAVPTQVVCARNMTSNSAMSIATKVAIQINCKLGGAPWRVEIPLQSIMVIGYDVCHDTRSKEKSFGGFVATLDRHLTRYFSAVNSHTSGEELSAHMGFNVAASLRRYREINGALPQRIFIYRDGVGDGQIPYVHSHEVAEIKKKLSEIYAEMEYKMAYIIVSKRINTRIFLDRGRNGENPRPGTVIDDVVTQPERYDFYLVSQNVREGTISPTSYNIIEDTTGLHPDRMQWLTYKLTHLYFNCSSQVRVPSVCQYAHKLAFLAANSLHSQPHYTLSDTLYFL